MGASVAFASGSSAVVANEGSGVGASVSFAKQELLSQSSVVFRNGGFCRFCEMGASVALAKWRLLSLFAKWSFRRFCNSNEDGSFYQSRGLFSGAVAREWCLLSERELLSLFEWDFEWEWEQFSVRM